jgi:hypothetical protein
MASYYSKGQSLKPLFKSVNIGMGHICCFFETRKSNLDVKLCLTSLRSHYDL